MEESTARLIVAFTMGVMLFYLSSQKCAYSEHSKISKLAKTAVYPVGVTDFHVTNSLYTWIYSILVITYRKDKELQVMPIIREWRENSVKPPIRFDVEEPYTKFLSIIDEARKNEVEPIFKVSSEYDYHSLPKILKFNDYVDCEDLLKRIDETTGGAVNE